MEAEFSLFIRLVPYALISQREGETDTAFTAQVDTLILDHRKQLNEIIGMSSDCRGLVIELNWISLFP
jgi:hypothetical protein